MENHYLSEKLSELEKLSGLLNIEGILSCLDELFVYSLKYRNFVNLSLDLKKVGTKKVLTKYYTYTFYKNLLTLNTSELEKCLFENIKYISVLESDLEKPIFLELKEMALKNTEIYIIRKILAILETKIEIEKFDLKDPGKKFYSDVGELYVTSFENENIYNFLDFVLTSDFKARKTLEKLRKGF